MLENWGKKKPEKPLTEMEKMAKKYEVWLPDKIKIDDINTESLTEEELRKMSAMFFKAALEWASHNMEYAGGYAALSNACTMQILLRREK